MSLNCWNTWDPTRILILPGFSNSLSSIAKLFQILQSYRLQWGKHWRILHRCGIMCSTLKQRFLYSSSNQWTSTLRFLLSSRMSNQADSRTNKKMPWWLMRAELLMVNQVVSTHLSTIRRFSEDRLKRPQIRKTRQGHLILSVLSWTWMETKTTCSRTWGI